MRSTLLSLSLPLLVAAGQAQDAKPQIARELLFAVQVPRRRNLGGGQAAR